jgi:hypothetical protein
MSLLLLVFGTGYSNSLLRSRFRPINCAAAGEVADRQEPEASDLGVPRPVAFAAVGLLSPAILSPSTVHPRLRAAVPRPRCRLNGLTGFPDPLRAEPIAPSRIEVITGDTIRVDGLPVRLLGFIAAQSGQSAGCELERRAAEAAKAADRNGHRHTARRSSGLTLLGELMSEGVPDEDPGTDP